MFATPTFSCSNQIKSNQFYLYSPKSQSHCLSGLYNLYSEQHPLSLDPRFELGKTSHVDGKKNNGRNLRKSHRGGIPLPGWTDMQWMLRVQKRATIHSLQLTWGNW